MGEYLSEEDMNTGEYISRDEALKIFHQCCDNCTRSYKGVMCRACADADAMDILIDIPAADVQPVKRGRWVQYNRNGEETYIECTNCCVPSRPRHLQMVTRTGEGLPDYCPNCGADMREFNE